MVLSTDLVPPGCSEPLFVPRGIVAGAKAGETVPKLKSTYKGHIEPGAVTITLREASHWPHRNSNRIAWLKFALLLRDRGERVIFVRDTEHAFEPFADFQTDPLASVDLDYRAALYESARANLFVSNGPAGLAMFGDKPWLQFVTLEDEDGYAPNTAKFWTENGGVAPGEQYPWSGSQQRLVWAPDTYENILEAWTQVIGDAQPIARNGRGRLPRAA